MCPEQLDCPCSCDLVTFETYSVKRNGGVWANILLEDNSTTIKKCVPKAAYADADRVQCITECSAEIKQDGLTKDLELQEDDFGDKEELAELENHD